MEIFFTTFFAVFFAELTDKTQLVGITMAAKTGKPWTVWVGSVTAYMLITAISVLLGTVLVKYFRPEIIKYTAASIFVLMGVLMLTGKI